MPYTVDDFKLELVIDKVDHFEHEDPPHEGTDVPLKFVVWVKYYINDKPIDAIGSFLTIREMHKYGIKKTVQFYKSAPYGMMEVFTCTCGVAGCNGMFNPIDIKVRRHTVEWRVPNRETEYPFLDANFYQFGTPMFEAEIKRVVNEMVQHLLMNPTAQYNML